MEQQNKLFRMLVEIVEKDSRYKMEAYTFVLSALNFTVSRLDKPGHISGQKLLEGIREYALEQFGPMARTVFEYWGVKNSRDFGEIVFNMVDNGLLSKQESDSMDDFKDGYDFREAFDDKSAFSL